MQQEAPSEVVRQANFAGAIFAGAQSAAALSFVLLSVGAALGFSRAMGFRSPGPRNRWRGGDSESRLTRRPTAV